MPAGHGLDDIQEQVYEDVKDLYMYLDLTEMLRWESVRLENHVKSIGVYYTNNLLLGGLI